jgi:hypothetical protein
MFGLFWLSFCRFQAPFRIAETSPQLHVELAKVHRRVVRDMRGRAAILSLLSIGIGIGLVYLIKQLPSLNIPQNLWPEIPDNSTDWFLIVFTALSTYFFSLSLWMIFSKKACHDWIRTMQYLDRPLSHTSLPKSMSQTVNRLAACSQQVFFSTVKPFGKLAKENYSLASFWIWVLESIAPASKDNENRKKRISEEIFDIDRRIQDGTDIFSSEKLSRHFGNTATSLMSLALGLIAGIPASIFLVWKIFNT